MSPLPNLSGLSLAHAPLATGVGSNGPDSQRRRLNNDDDEDSSALWEDLPEDVLRQVARSFGPVRDMCGAVDALLRAGRATHHIFEWKKIADQYAMPVPRPADDAALDVWRKYVMGWCAKLKPMDILNLNVMLAELEADGDHAGFDWVRSIRGGWYNRGRALKEASQQGRADVVGRLLAANAPLDTTTASGQTALIIASRAGSVEIVQMLLDAGAVATVNATDVAGRTALMYASREGHAVIVLTLLAAGASVDVSDRMGNTALSYASGVELREHADVVALLRAADGRRVRS